MTFSQILNVKKDKKDTLNGFNLNIGKGNVQGGEDVKKLIELIYFGLSFQYRSRLDLAYNCLSRDKSTLISFETITD